jgi:NitT/TauT family transport system substrate-binding protein
MMRTKHFGVSAAAFTVLLGLLAANEATAQGLKTITFVQPSPSAINSYQVYVAIGEGYFRDEGLEVRAQAVDGSGQVLQAMAAGQAQIGRPGPAPLLKARQRGVDVVFLYNALPVSAFGIVVKAGSAYKTPLDLKGKVIGVGTRDGAEVGFTRSILTELKMTEGKDYTFIPVGDGGPATAGFLRGEIEAYAASTADAAILNHRGMAVRDITPEKFKGYFANGYAAMADYVAKNPDVIEGFGRALVRASKFTFDPANREKVLKHLAAGVPQEIEDRNFANALLDSVLAKSKPADMSKWGYQKHEDWETWHKSLIEAGELKEPIKDLQAAYTNRFNEAWNKSK